jgi:hypothetical protein
MEGINGASPFVIGKSGGSMTNGEFLMTKEISKSNDQSLCGGGYAPEVLIEECACQRARTMNTYGPKVPINT